MVSLIESLPSHASDSTEPYIGVPHRNFGIDQVNGKMTIKQIAPRVAGNNRRA